MLKKENLQINNPILVHGSCSGGVCAAGPSELGNPLLDFGSTHSKMLSLET